MPKKLTLQQALSRMVAGARRSVPARSVSTYPSQSAEYWRNYPRPPGWVAHPDMPWISIRSSGASNASALDALKAQQQELLEKGSLGNQRHPDHVNDLYEYRRVTNLILSMEAPQKPEPEAVPMLSHLVREIDREPAADRKADAQQVFNEMIADRTNPVHDPASARHDMAVADLQKVLEIISTEEK